MTAPENDAHLVRSCRYSGCQVLPNFVGADGWCVTHHPDKSEHKARASRGGTTKAMRTRKAMPLDTPTPDWSTPKAIRAWAEDRAGRVERVVLGGQLVPTKLAEIAKSTL